MRNTNTILRQDNMHASMDAKLGHVLLVSYSSEPLVVYPKTIYIGKQIVVIFLSTKTLDLFLIFWASY
jgi:hypothetical protein